MKTISRFITLCVVAATAIHCSSSDDDAATPAALAPTLNTVSADNISGLSVTLSGNITSVGGGVFQFGFCLSEEPNPTTSDQTFGVDGSAGGPFSATIDVPSPDTTYHVRAYAVGVNGITAYGSDIAFTSAFPLAALPVKEIVTDRALFRANILSLPDNLDAIGYCYGTSPSPTLANGEEIYFADALGYQETMNVVQLDPMTPNTNYFVRPFYRIYGDDTIHYGAQSTFRTAGYFGPAGGYVAYDKGETTDGWRYLEIDPSGILYNNSSYPQWGCNSTLISNTYPEMGTGFSNTQTIVSSCGAANSAARLCYNYTRNGFSDWFLGSRYEMEIIVRSLRAVDVELSTCWTSSEITAWQAYYVYINGNDVLAQSSSKSSGNQVFPIRRY